MMEIMWNDYDMIITDYDYNCNIMLQGDNAKFKRIPREDEDHLAIING